MKGNDGTGNTIERDEWQTPQKLWNELNKQYHFTFDCCAGHDNHKTVKYSVYDFLDIKQLEHKSVWMNPPFSKAKEMFDHFFRIVNSGVCIYRCDNMETKVWQDIILPNASWIAIPKGRISYEGFESKGSRFPSALIGFNVDIPILEGFTILKTHQKGDLK